MRDDEAAQLEEQLREVVRDAGLQWVLDQVDELVLEGKPEFKRVRGASGDETEAYVRELTTKRGVPRSEPYTAAERLALLLNALERIISQPLQLEAEIAASATEDEALDDVVWVDEIDRVPMRSIGDADWRDQAARAARADLTPALRMLMERVEG